MLELIVPEGQHVGRIKGYSATPKAPWGRNVLHDRDEAHLVVAVLRNKI